MAYTLSNNLKLRLDSNLTANSLFNLKRLDELGGTFLLDNTGTLRIRSAGGIQLQPNDAGSGGSGAGGTISLGSQAQPLTALNLYTSQFLLSGPLSLADTTPTGTKSLLVQYASTGPDNVASRTLSIDVLGANRRLALGGDLVTNGSVSLTALGGTSALNLPATGTVATLDGVQVLTNKTISGLTNTLTNLPTSALVGTVLPSLGGTGVANANASTLTLVGAYPLALTLSGATGVTLPQTGTLATLAGAEVLTNKVLDAGSNTVTNLTNASIAPAAGIVYSKLSLTGGIVNSDVSGSAGISTTKLAPLTANQVVVTNGSGFLATSAALSTTLGGTGVSGSATYPTSGTVATDSNTLTFTNKSISGATNTLSAVPYSALQLTGSIVNADVAAGAAIAYSKLNLTGALVNSDVNAAAAIAGSKVSPDFANQQISTDSSILFRVGGHTTTLQAAQSGQSTNLTFSLPPNAGTNGQVLSTNGSGVTSWTTGSGTGTVTSVGLSAPASILSVSGSPVTGVGTLALSLATQTANTVWAGPTTGSPGTPTFRALVLADLPAGTGYITSVSNTASVNLAVSAGNLTAALPALTASQAVVSDGSGLLSTSVTTAAELAFVSGVTSSIQTQLNGKQASGSYITALTSDVAASGPGSAVATIQANVVSNAKLAQMPANTFKGNNTGSTANALDLTAAQVTAGLNLFSSTLQGLVPASGGGTTNFLRADGTWSVAGTGTVTAVSVVSANGLAGTSSGGATPALTLSTTVTGLVKGNGAALSAATAGTDYSAGTSALATGILKSTTTTGALTIAVAGDFPVLNQNTTGTASNVTGLVLPANGGTGLATLTANSLLVGAGTGAVTFIAPGSLGNVLTSNGTTWSSAAPATNGTVTSVALTAPAFLSVAGSPITTSGTLALSLATQTANQVFAGPTSGGALAPTFRSLVAADIPAISLTTGVSGVLPIANGGTNASTTLNNNRVIKSSGGSLVEAAAIAANLALVSDANGIPVASVTTTAELAFVSGVTSSIQTQLNGKQASGSYITALTGDVAASGPGSAASLIQANVVSNAKLAQMPANTFKGNNTGSTANALDLTATQVTAGLNLFTSSLQGLVPASGGGTTNFLRADGTWAVAGTGTVTAVSVVSANGLAGTSSGGATPALTLSTTVTGLVKGNGTALSAATAGTDYSAGTSALATGILKSTTTTGALSIAIAADFPVLNQNTTGTASNVTGLVLPANGGTGLATLTASSLLVGAGTGAVTFIAPGSSGNVLTSNGTTWSSAAPATNGTVTSVALTAPAFLSVAGSPVTTSGTLALTLATQTANQVFAGPTSGGALAPTFRSLVAADIPAISLTTGVSGVLPIANGGTNTSAALNNNRIIKSSGGAHVEAAAIAANLALVSDANGIPVGATTTTTELNYLSGTTSSVQTQLNGKQASSAELTGLAALSATGLVTRTASGTYTARSIVATSATSGLALTNGSGVSGNPTLNVDIPGTTVSTGVHQADQVLLYDNTAGALRQTTVSAILTSVTSSAAATWNSGTSFSLTHNLGTNDIAVSTYDISTGATVLVDTITRTSVNAITLTSSTAAPGTGWRVVVISTGSIAYSPGSGTVTSVGMTVPSILSVSGTPITSSGTLALTLATQTANTVWAGPTTGSPGTPTFRALVLADMPAGTGYITSVSNTASVNLAVASGALTATIPTNGVTNSLLAQMPANTFKGNNTGSTANALDLTAAQATAMMNTFTSSLNGDVPASGGGTTNFLRADATWAAPAAAGSNGQIQYNSSGAFGAGTNLTWDSTNLRLGVGSVAPVGAVSIDLSNTGAVNTGGAGTHLLMTNPSSTGQTSVMSLINGTAVAKWRTDYQGNINWVSYGGYQAFYTGGDNGVGNIKIACGSSTTGTVAIGNFASIPGSTGQLQVEVAVAANNGITVKGIASQTGALFQARNSSASVLYSLDKVGRPSTGNTTATIAAGTGAGTGPTVSIAGTDVNGVITVTTGTAPTGTNATIATVTFSTAWGTAPKTVIISPAEANAAGLSGTSQVFAPSASISTTVFVLTSGTLALTASTTYKWYYQVLG